MDDSERVLLDELKKDSVQARARAAPWESANYPGIGPTGFGDWMGPGSLIIQLGQTADEFISWSYYPMRRDRQLRAFYKTEGIMAGAVYSLVSRIKSLPQKIKGGSRSKLQAQLLMRGLNLGKLTLDTLTTDNGFFIERVGPGRPDKPLPKGLIRGLSVMDSCQCWRTFDPEYPVIYVNPYTAQYHKMHYSRIISGSSLPQADELARGIGYCAISRAMRYTQIMRDIAIYKHEKVGGRFSRAIGAIQGFTPRTVRETLLNADLEQTSLGYTRYRQVPFLVGQNEIKMQLLDLASLPDGFDVEKDTQTYVYCLALAFGVDAREFWPATGGGATKADATVQHEKARGKGIADIVSTLERELNFGVMPGNAELEFDNTDDAQDLAQAQIHFQVITNIGLLQQQGNISVEQGTAMLVEEGVLDPDVLSQVKNPELTLPATDLVPYEDAPPLPDKPEPPALPPTTTAQPGAATEPSGIPKRQLPKPMPPGGSIPSGMPTFGKERRQVAYKQIEDDAEAFREELEGMMRDFIDDGYPDDDDDLDQRVDQLKQTFASKLASGLTKAFLIGLAGKLVTEAGKHILQKIADDQASYASGFLDDLHQRLQLSDYAQDNDLTPEEFLGGFVNRAGLYAGGYWNSVWAGIGAGLSEERYAPRVMRVLDPEAEHCSTCPDKAGIYDSFEDMEAEVGLPGDGSDDCLSNCRCKILVEATPGSGDFQELHGRPSAYTTALIDANSLAEAM